MSPTPAGSYAATIVLLVAATAAVVARTYVRFTKKANFGLDDVFIYFGLVLTWVLAALLLYGIARGTIGTHTARDAAGKVIVTHHEPDIAKLGYISQIISIVAYGALKLSVLFLYRRIFIGNTFQKVSLAAMILVVTWVAAFLFAQIFQCGGNPTWYWTSPQALATHCGRYREILLGHAVSDVITDLIVLAIPLPIIWKLHLNVSQKFGLLFIFLLGYMSTAAAAARVAYMVTDLWETTTGARDVRGNYTNYMIWGYVEAGVGVVAVTLPTLRPLINSRLPESIVNSVRSKLSIGSNRSQKKNQKSDTDLLATDTSNIELRNMGAAGETRTETETRVTHTSHSNIPGDQIVVEQSVDIDETRR